MANSPIEKDREARRRKAPPCLSFDMSGTIASGLYAEAFASHTETRVFSDLAADDEAGTGNRRQSCDQGS